MFSKGIVVIAITKRGVETALRIKDELAMQGLHGHVFAPVKYNQAGVVALEKKIDEFVKETYNKSDAIVAVMATGIIIRAVAPLLESKLVDPAVVGVDVSGRFVISLLSGHYGGANELTRLIADGIGATPVITTASDVLGKQSIDELARVLHLKIINPESLVAVNSAIVNGERLVLVTLGDVNVPLTRVLGFNVERADTAEVAAEIVNRYCAGAVITKATLSHFRFTKPVSFNRVVTLCVLRSRTDIRDPLRSV